MAKIVPDRLTSAKDGGINSAVAPQSAIHAGLRVQGMGVVGLGTVRKTKHESRGYARVFRVVVALLPLSLTSMPAPLWGQSSADVRNKIQQSGHTETEVRQRARWKPHRRSTDGNVEQLARHAVGLAGIEHDLAGIAVHIGARVAALATPGEVLVSQTVRDLVAGSGLAFEDRGSHRLKGVPDDWRLFRAVLN